MLSYVNKKVLLRERKRHTARRVASARYAALSSGWGGYPIPGWGVPQSGLDGGWYPPPHHPDQGTPPHHTNLAGGGDSPLPSRPGMGHPPWLGYPPPPSRPGQGTPPRDGVSTHHPDLAGEHPLPPPQT